MKEEETRLREEVRRLPAKAEGLGAEEDARCGRDSRGHELPAELQRREDRPRRILATQSRHLSSAPAKRRGPKAGMWASSNAVEGKSGQKPGAVLTDSGYRSEENLREATKLGVEAYVAVGKHRHNGPVPPCRRGPIPKTATLLDRMKRKLRIVAGCDLYARRRQSSNRSSARSNRHAASGGSFYAASARCRANRLWSAPDTTG